MDRRRAPCRCGHPGARALLDRSALFFVVVSRRRKSPCLCPLPDAKTTTITTTKKNKTKEHNANLFFSYFFSPWARFLRANKTGRRCFCAPRPFRPMAFSCFLFFLRGHPFGARRLGCTEEKTNQEKKRRDEKPKRPSRRDAADERQQTLGVPFFATSRRFVFFF
nr:hypothetical protein [Pandoravirus belohorizontensis]